MSLFLWLLWPEGGRSGACGEYIRGGRVASTTYALRLDETEREGFDEDAAHENMVVVDANEGSWKGRGVHGQRSYRRVCPFPASCGYSCG